MNISTIICTYNRSQSLKRTLDSVCELSIPSELEWELIVVDNNSKDDIKAVVERFRRNSGLNIRYVFEGKRGLSHARNRGIQESKGRIIAFTDDDMCLSKYWIVKIKQEFLSEEENVIFGRVMPTQNSPFKLSTKKALSAEKYYWPCNPWEIGHGNSMYIKRSVFNNVGFFDVKLGAGTSVGSAEDTDLIYRILKKGYKILYSPSIVNYHNHGRVERKDVDAIKFNYAKGRGAFYTKHILRGDSYVSRLCYWEIKKFLAQLLRYGKSSNWQEINNVVMNLKGLAQGFCLRIITEIKHILF